MIQDMTLRRMITRLKSPLFSSYSLLVRRKLLLLIMVFMVTTVLFLHFYLLPIVSGTYNDECYLSKEKHRNLRYAVQTIGQTMEKYNITYWLDYGTLLGAMKYGDVLPWDGDADVSFLLQHEKSILHEMLYKLHGIHSNGLHATYKSESIDYMRWTQRRGLYNGKEETFLYKYYPNSVLSNENIIVKYHHKLETFPMSWALPTRSVDFNGVKLRIPNKPHKLLRHRYPWTYTFGLLVPYKWKCWVPCWIRTTNAC